MKRSNGSNTSGFLPPMMSYVTYDVVRNARTTSYVQHTTSCWTSHVRCRTCDIQDVDVRHRTYDVVRNVRYRTSTYDIVRHTYDIVRVHLHISYTMSYVGNGYTMSYVHDIRYRMFISYTTSYVRTMSHVNIRYRMSDVQCRMSSGGGRFRCFKGTRSPAHSTGKWAVPFRQQELHF